MKREIKFRALVEWDNGKRTFEYYSTFDQPSWMDDPFGKIIVKDMQYSGLRDRNGKKIYEGDITKTPNRIGIVSYHNARAMFIIQDGFNEPLYQFAPMVDVIGNIHENPELLK